MFRFEKLDVWHEAVAFAALIYQVTRKFPPEERYGLTSQMRRSSVSVSSNIAEGSGRPSDVEFNRFLEIAYGSLMEVVSQSHVARQENYLTDDELETIRTRAEKLARMLSGLSNKLKSRIAAAKNQSQSGQ